MPLQWQWCWKAYSYKFISYTFEKIIARHDLHSTVDLGKITVGYHLRRLVADTDLEASRAPVNELDRALCLEPFDSAVSILGNDISTVEQAGSHVLSVAGITLDHLVVGLEARHGNLHSRVSLVPCPLGRDDWRVSDEREVNAWVWYEVGLEFVQVNVERAVEAEGCGDG